MLFEALTTRKTVTVGEKLIVPYKLAEVSHSGCTDNFLRQKKTGCLCLSFVVFIRLSST